MTDITERLFDSTQWHHADVELKKEAIDEIKRLRGALEEIRDIARVSEGTEFYAMLAERGLKETNK